VLTGADGYGFLKYTATTTGTFNLTARTSNGSDSAQLRVVAATDRTVLFEIEPILWRSLAGDLAAARRVMARVAAGYELVYLCGLMGRRAAGRLISDRGLPARIVLQGKGRDQLARLRHRGIRIHAVVGAPALIDAARGLTTRRISFERHVPAVQVDTWDDLWKHLNAEEQTP
jgi:hypothetical protein